MTNEQIRKALECCSNKEVHFCTLCPMFIRDKENDFCQEDLAKKALLFINRQKADIENLEIELQAMRGAANSYKIRYEKALDRIKKNVFPSKSWTEEDFEHYKTIVEALERACNNG